MRWVEMGLTFLVIEGVIAGISFFVGVVTGSPAKMNHVIRFFVEHPFCSIGPAILSSIWVFLVGVYSAHVVQDRELNGQINDKNQQLIDNDRQLELLRSEVRSLKTTINDRRPNFFGTVEQLLCADHPTDSEGIISTVLLTIRNRGEPSIAERYSVHVELPDGRKVEGEKRQISETRLWIGEGSSALEIPGAPRAQLYRTITARDAIYNKSLTPIPRGGLIRGYLQAYFRGLTHSEITQKGTRVVVGVHDINDRYYEIWGKLGGPNPIGHHKYYPGTDVLAE